MLIKAAKPAVQIITNYFVSLLISTFGYSSVFLAGSCLLAISIGIMLSIQTTGSMLLSRLFQGVGSSLGTVSGLGMIGSFHYNENIKMEQMSKAMSGLALGVLLGPPLSSLCTEYYGMNGLYIMLLILIFGSIFAALLVKLYTELRVTSHSSVMFLLAVFITQSSNILVGSSFRIIAFYSLLSY